MKVTTFIIASLLLCNLVFAQIRLFPVRVDRKWGFVDTKGNLVIRPKYDAVGEFGENSYTRFSLNGKLGIVQTNGTELFLGKGQDADVIDDSTVAIKVDTLWGVRHIDGKELLPIAFDKVFKSDRGNYWVTKGAAKGVFGDQGQTVVPCRFQTVESVDSNLIKASTHDSDYYFSKKGKRLFKGRFDQFNHQYYPVVIDENNASTWKIFHLVSKQNFKGFNRYSPIDSIRFQLFSNDSSWVFNVQTGERFAVDINDEICVFNPNYLWFKRFGKVGILSLKGEQLVRAEHDAISFQNGVFIIWNGRRKGVIDGRGNKRLLPIYENISFHSSGLMILQNHGLLGCAKPSGQLLLKPAFSQLEYSDRQLRGYRNGALVFVDFDGRWNIKDEYEFKKVKTIQLDFEQGIVPVSATDLAATNIAAAPPAGWFQSTFNRRWGFRRPDSSFRHTPQFTQVDHFTTGFTVVRKFKAEFGFGEVLDDTYVQDAVEGLAFTQNGNYQILPKYWHIFPQELWRGDVEYARMLTFTGKQQVFLYKKGVRVKKNYEFIDSLVEDRARFAIGGHLSVGDNPKAPTNVCSQLNFKQFIGYDSIVFPTTVRANFRKHYIKFEYAKWGYLSKSGKEIIPAKFDFVSPFHQGTAIVQYKKKWGVIDLNGNFIIDPIYFRVRRIQYQNRSYFQVFKPEPRFGLVDSLGEIRVYPEYRRAMTYENGFLGVKLPDGWTFIDSNRMAICSPEYERVQPFSHGMAAVEKGGKWGFINTNGDLKVATEYQNVLPFSDKYAWVQYRGKWLLIDENGLSMSTKSFKNPRPFGCGTTWVKKDKGSRYGLLNSNTEFLIKPRFNSVEIYTEDSLSVVTKKNRKALVNNYGEIITPFIFQSIDSFSNGWAHAVTEKGAVLLHKSGRQKPLKKEYYEKSCFYDGLSRVKYEGFYGFIDTNGTEIVPCMYTRAQHFKTGLTFCKQPQKRTHCINTLGNKVFATPGWVAHHFQENRAIIKSAGREFYIDREGRMLFGNTYEDAEPFSQGLARVRTGKKWVLINRLGQPLMTPKFVQIKDFEGPYGVVKRNGSHGLFDNDGKVVLDVIYDELELIENRYYFLSVHDKIGHFDLASGWVWEPER